MDALCTRGFRETQPDGRKCGPKRSQTSLPEPEVACHAVVTESKATWKKGKKGWKGGLLPNHKEASSFPSSCDGFFHFFPFRFRGSEQSLWGVSKPNTQKELRRRIARAPPGRITICFFAGLRSYIPKSNMPTRKCRIKCACVFLYVCIFSYIYIYIYTPTMPPPIPPLPTSSTPPPCLIHQLGGSFPNIHM